MRRDGELRLTARVFMQREQAMWAKVSPLLYALSGVFDLELARDAVRWMIIAEIKDGLRSIIGKPGDRRILTMSCENVAPGNNLLYPDDHYVFRMHVGNLIDKAPEDD